MEASPVTKVLRDFLGSLPGPVAGSDAELLERFVSRHEEAAFTALVQRHGPMVLSLCRRMLNNPSDIEDAFQAAFVILARRAGAIAKKSSLASWLHGVARKTCSCARRSASRRRDREQALKEAAGSCCVPAPSVEGDLRPILDEELGRLPGAYRAPLVLCYLEGRSVDEAAAELGWPRGTVAGRMSRGRDLLRKRLERRGLALSVAALTAQLESTATAAVPAPMLQELVPAGFGSGTGIRDGAAILAREFLHGIFWNKVRWAGVLITCLLTFGTAGVKWIASSGKPAASAHASPGQGDDFYVRWRFDEGPPKDIRVLIGRWAYRAGENGAVPDPKVVVLLPTQVPKRPFVLSVWTRRQEPKQPGHCSSSAYWLDGDHFCARRSWSNNVAYVPGLPRPWLRFYFWERWSACLVSHSGSSVSGDLYGVQRYQAPYPGERLALRLEDTGEAKTAIQEIELRGMRPGEKATIRQWNMEETTETMREGPADFPAVQIPAVFLRPPS